MQSKREKPNNEAKQEIVVFWIIKPSQCTECRTELFKGSLLRLEQEKALCTDCADLGHLEFLASGDTAVTRRATKYSKLRAVVVRWSRARKRYERQGILVEPEAIIRAEEESLADTEVRERRQARVAERRAVEDQDFMASFARAIREQYPNCPAGKEAAIAEHACRKYTGRVGRSAAAKEFSEEAIRLAVAAHIRHRHTDYDELLDRYADRQAARREVRDQVSAILENWQKPAIQDRKDQAAP